MEEEDYLGNVYRKWHFWHVIADMSPFWCSNYTFASNNPKSVHFPNEFSFHKSCHSNKFTFFSAEFHKKHNISGNHDTSKKTLIPNSLTSINSLKTWPLILPLCNPKPTCLLIYYVCIIDIFFVCLLFNT